MGNRASEWRISLQAHLPACEFVSARQDFELTEQRHDARAERKADDDESQLFPRAPVVVRVKDKFVRDELDRSTALSAMKQTFAPTCREEYQRRSSPARPKRSKQRQTSWTVGSALSEAEKRTVDSLVPRPIAMPRGVTHE